MLSFLRRLLGGGAPRPRPPASGDPERIAAVEVVLERLRPGLRADGGDVDLVAVDDAGRVHLAFRGACTDCGARSLTLRAAVEPALRADLTWFGGVVESS